MYILLRAASPAARASLHLGVLKVLQIFKSYLLPFNLSSTSANAVTSTEASDNCALGPLQLADVFS